MATSRGRYHCADCADAEEFYDKYGEDYWMTDLEDYDKKCKVEPLMRAMKETDTDAWINGRRCCSLGIAPHALTLPWAFYSFVSLPLIQMRVLGLESIR